MTTKEKAFPTCPNLSSVSGTPPFLENSPIQFSSGQFFSVLRFRDESREWLLQKLEKSLANCRSSIEGKTFSVRSRLRFQLFDRERKLARGVDSGFHDLGGPAK